MRVQKLILEQFRCYEKAEIDMADGNIHLFIGPNAAGKTNILEALSLLAFTKSCRGADEADLFLWDADYYKVRAEALTDAGERKSFELISQMLPRKKKVCFADDVKTSVGSMVGLLPILVFLPQELDLFTGPPQQRRAFLDQLLCQVSPEYLANLVRYNGILKQRNKLLRAICEGGASAQRDALEVWDMQLAESGALITLKRLELLEVLQCTLAQELADLGEDWEDATIVYERKGGARELLQMRDELTQLLALNRDRDIMLQSTTSGPHREDWKLRRSGRNVASFASRGQLRTAVLALLFLQVSYLELRRGEKPIILLDDVFSELDDAHQSALLTSFEGHQVLVTGTHVPAQLHGANLWNVSQGVIASA